MAPPLPLPLRPYQSTWHIRAEPPSGGWSSIIGIVVAIIGNVLISFALNTQRYAHIKLSREREEREARYREHKGREERARGYGTSQEGEGSVRERRRGREDEPLLDRERRDSVYTDAGEGKEGPKDKSYLSSGWWWLGISLMTIGEGGNFLAYGFAPASVVSPLGVVALVSNCLIAPWMLHESFRKRDALGVLIAVAGCVVVVLSASGSNPKLDADQIWKLISTWEFETYFGITVFLIVMLMAASNKYGEKSILIDLGLVGLFGGYTALSTKGVASLLSNTIWRVVTFPVTYLLVAILVFTAIMQIKYVNRALQRFDSTQVIPTQFVMFTLSVIIGSAILYRDFERQSSEDAVKFFAGCALTFLGVWCITSGRSRDSNHNEDNSSDENSAIHLQDDEADLPHHPSTPQRTMSSLSAGPALRLETSTPPDVLSPLPTTTPWSPSRATASNSAIHHPPSRMRPSSSGDKPPLHATTSDPILPTSAFSDRQTPFFADPSPSSPLLRTTTADRPRTPSPIPQTPDATTPRFGSIGRHSIADMLPHPGPLTNPLSNSLSAIVADSIRRGVDHMPGSMRRKSLRSRRSRREEGGQFADLLAAEGEAEAEAAASAVASAGETRGE
ncbi:hypothetical protein CAC42_5042 [Sphaceloma murrayae]|uniref:NIPA-like protein 2 n=1 Tax=Sphaceloma murrayae TaxID=2082308 RepID=A0A2K1QUE6_9PEZI|nr:hypothetical protein CAC42_5042 [Sphaceloma murrayae]